MDSDRLSFPSIPSELSQPSRPPDRASEESTFAALYSEAMQAASQELSQIASADSTDSASSPGDSMSDDSMSFVELCMQASAFGAGDPSAPASEDFAMTHGELLQQVGAIRLGQRPGAEGASVDWERPAFSAGDAAIPASGATQRTEGALSSGVHRLISWLDAHAHLHSTHRCAASVREAMEAAGIQTADRPPSGDAGDYGPFLMRHGAQVIPEGSYEPKAGDIAVFDRSEDHPAGHIQVFDGQHWVSDFVQHTFSPYRDQGSTPPVTVYRLS